jgi:hypothetical protein
MHILNRTASEQESINLEWKQMRNNKNCEILDRVDVDGTFGCISTYMVVVTDFACGTKGDKAFYAVAMLNGAVVSIVNTL